jgi:hypothetical protein
MKFYYVLTFQSFSIRNQVELFFCHKQLVGKIPLAFQDFNTMNVLETSYNQLVGKLNRLWFPQ